MRVLVSLMETGYRVFDSFGKWGKIGGILGELG